VQQQQQQRFPSLAIIANHAALYVCTLDVPLILALIHALAAYEREPPSTVKATEASLTDTLFGATPYAKVILAFTPAGEPAGMALYFNNYSTWRAAPGIYLEDLFVYEEFRGLGYGTALLAALAKEVLQIHGKRLEWSVLKCKSSFGGERATLTRPGTDRE
jgi:GNAT superfamily N-acetyltransferase